METRARVSLLTILYLCPRVNGTIGIKTRIKTRIHIKMIKMEVGVVSIWRKRRKRDIILHIEVEVVIMAEVVVVIITEVMVLLMVLLIIIVIIILVLLLVNLNYLICWRILGAMIRRNI